MHGGNRHKNMGKLISDAFDDLDQEDYYEETDPWAAWEGMEEDIIGRLKSPDTLFAQVYDVTGEEFTEDQVKVALEKREFDPERAIDYLMNPPQSSIGKKKPKIEQNANKSILN
jgi:hypothetical protein